MTALSDLTTEIKAWVNFEYEDVLVHSWIKMAEEILSEQIRCKHMIATDTADITDKRVNLPIDWLALDFVRLVDGKPLHYKTRDDFYGDMYTEGRTNEGYYTVTGNSLIVGGDIDGTKSVEISYYKIIPPLDEANWLYTFYRRLYISATLSVAFAYSIDEARAATWQAATEAFIGVINDGHMTSKASGSRLSVPRRKGFE